MIVSYLLLIVLTMPSNVPDVKIQMPAANIIDCLSMTDKLGEIIAVKNPISVSMQCQPIVDKPPAAREGEHVD